MTIVASILCIAIVAVLHVTVVQKNPKLTNRVCITGANIILSLAFVVLLYAINPVQDEANSYIDSQIALLEQKVNEIYPDAMNKQMSTVEVKETLMKALEKNKDGTADKKKGDRYLPAHWEELARRYGHKYVFRGGWRDNYPQVITSRYPIEGIARITGKSDTLFTADGIQVSGTPDTLVAHGAGWARIRRNGKTLNIVTLHTWPQAYGFNVPLADRERSKAAHEGDKYRRTEMEYICKHTIGTVPEAAGQYWMMMGDFNSLSRVDNYLHQFPEDDTRLLVHDYIRSETPYIDVIFEREPENHYSSTGGKGRIDFVYCTKPLYDCITAAHIHTDDYTRPVRNPQKISNFWHPSDHRPIIVDFDLSK